MKFRETIFKLLSTLKPFWKPYLLVCLIGLTAAALEMIPPRLIGESIDKMAQPGGFDLKEIIWMAGLWLAVATAVQTLSSFQIKVANHYGEAVISSLRERLFVHLQKLSMSYFDRTHIGTLLSVHGGDVDSVRNVLIWGLNTVITNSAIMILSATMIYTTSSKLFFATVWLFPVLACLNFFYGKKITSAWDQVRHHSSLVGANQAENIAGIRVVHAFNRQTSNLAHYNQLQETNTFNNVRAAKKSGLFHPLLHWVRFMGVVIILLFGGYELSQNRIKAGTLITTLLYWEWFMSPAINFGAFFNELLISITGASRLFNVLEEKPDVEDHPNAISLPPLKGLVQFKDVNFRYNQEGRDILKNINFTVNPGQTVALVGETGSGKSTIISLISRFYLPYSGEIQIDGYDLRYVTGESLHRQTAMVLQANFLFSGSIMDNLKYSRPDANDEDIYEAAKTLGCHERFMSMKNQYLTDVGEKGSALSLGERQLVCFVRALVANPRILLLDEATSALDPVTGHQVQMALQKLIKGRTTFIVTHRLSTVKNVDLILVLENGSLVESGHHIQLLKQNSYYAKLYRSSLTKKSFGISEQSTEVAKT